MTEVGLGFRRDANETWREAMLRIAKPWGLEAECIEEYDACIVAGGTEARAAYHALYEWDILDLYVDGKPVEP